MVKVNFSFLKSGAAVIAKVKNFEKGLTIFLLSTYCKCIKFCFSVVFKQQSIVVSLKTIVSINVMQ